MATVMGRLGPSAWTLPVAVVVLKALMETAAAISMQTRNRLCQPNRVDLSQYLGV